MLVGTGVVMGFIVARAVWQSGNDASFAALGLPGGAMMDTGLDDLAAGRETPDSLLVSLAATRLRREGVPVPRTLPSDAEWRLYRMLEETGDDLAHARYLARLRLVMSFADACHAIRAQRNRHAS